MMRAGISDIDWERIIALFSGVKGIEKAILYGSRAKGNYRKFSDVDITLVGDRLTREELLELYLALDDLLLPYRFDLSLFHSLRSQSLIDHINRAGVTLYTRR